MKGGYYKTPLGYKIADWFVDEIIKQETRMKFWFENSENGIIMTKENREDFESINIFQISEKEFNSDKFRDHCHSTRENRATAEDNCNVNVN